MYYVSRNIQRPQEIKKSTVDIDPGFLASNFNYTDFDTAYYRGLTDDQIFKSELGFLFEEDLYSQQINEKEIFT